MEKLSDAKIDNMIGYFFSKAQISMSDHKKINELVNVNTERVNNKYFVKFKDIFKGSVFTFEANSETLKIKVKTKYELSFLKMVTQNDLHIYMSKRPIDHLMVNVRYSKIQIQYGEQYFEYQTKVLINNGEGIEKITVNVQNSLMITKKNIEEIVIESSGVEFKIFENEQLLVNKVHIKRGAFKSNGIFQRINILDIQKDVKCELEGTEINMVHLNYPEIHEIKLINCRIIFRKKQLKQNVKKYKDDIGLNNLISTFEIIYNLEYLKKYKEDIHRNILFLRSYNSPFKRLLFEFNGGYYEFWWPLMAIVFIFVLQHNHIIEFDKLQFDKYFSVYLLDPSKLFIIIKEAFQKSWYWTMIEILFRAVLYYSVYSLLVTIKRKFGFQKIPS